MKEHMDLLGMHVIDKVTGFKGVVTTMSFDLYGCVQAVVSPGAKDEKLERGQWFDTKRLVLDKGYTEEPVMPVPTYEPLAVAGGAEKPSLNTKPLR